MADILPKPTDTTEQPIIDTRTALEPESPRAKRTMWVLISLVIIGVLCLVGAYIYDYVTNRDQDNTRKADLAYIANNLNGYYDLFHKYPTLSQLNSSDFGAFAPSLNRAKFKDPSSTTASEQLSAKPTDTTYGYEVGPANCNNTTVSCTDYKLATILTSGQHYIVSSPVPKS